VADLTYVTDALPGIRRRRFGRGFRYSTPDGGPLDDCPVVEGTGYRVYPPHSFTGIIVSSSDPVPACNSSTVFMKVGPVAASS